MRLVHLSDLHLGFRQYQRLTPAGINQREADVARTFQTAIDRIIALAPNVIVVGGDIFHSVRPTNPAIVHAFLQFSRLRAALPDAPVILVAGNHDTPRATETGSILRLFHELGVHVAHHEPRHLHFPALDLSVLAVPDVPATRPALLPSGSARRNVLLLHGEISGVLPAHASAADRAAVEIAREDLRAPQWTYVALGHYHVYRQVEPNAYYSGSIDYTSANPWGELYEERIAGLAGKGFIEHDLDSGAHRFHALPASRPLLDLPAISARGLAVEDVNARIRDAVDGAAGGIDERIVRLVVRDLPRHVARDLDQKALREYKRRALYFHLDSRRPEVMRHTATGAPGRRPSLADVVREKLMSRVLEPGIDRGELVELGLRYLRDAERSAATADVGAPLLEGSE